MFWPYDVVLKSLYPTTHSTVGTTRGGRWGGGGVSSWGQHLGSSLRRTCHHFHSYLWGGGAGQKVCLLHNAHLKGEFARLLPLSRENGPSGVFNLKGKDQNLEVFLPKDEIEGCLEDSKPHRTKI
jgi:hypothetical protein